MNIKDRLKQSYDLVYQALLVSGTNIKTINNSSVLGSGNLVVSGEGAVSSVNEQTGAVVLNQDNIGDGTTYKQYSQTEKSKLSGVETGANNYSHPSTHSADIITDGSTNKAYTGTEQTKLSGIETGANNYTHPANHAPSIITQDASNRFVTDTEKNTWNGKSNLVLGDLITNAYYGDKGKTAYDHSQVAHAPSNAQKNSDILKSEIEAVLTGEISSHSHAGGGGESEVIVVKTGDTANATTNLADAVDLTFTALANSTYIIEGFICWSASAATVGIKLSATAPTSPTLLAGHFITDAVNGTPDSSSFNANDVTVTTSASAFTTGNIASMCCVLKTAGNAGNFQIRFAAETTGTITMKAGSVLRYRKIV